MSGKGIRNHLDPLNIDRGNRERSAKKYIIAVHAAKTCVVT